MQQQLKSRLSQFSDAEWQCCGAGRKKLVTPWQNYYSQLILRIIILSKHPAPSPLSLVTHSATFLSVHPTTTSTNPSIFKHVCFQNHPPSWEVVFLVIMPAQVNIYSVIFCYDMCCEKLLFHWSTATVKWWGVTLFHYPQWETSALF